MQRLDNCGDAFKPWGFDLLTQRAAGALMAGVLFSGTCLASVGFQPATVPDPTGKGISAGIWYPSNTAPSPHPLETFSQDVALNAPIAGYGLPLILISHGTGGSLASHYDTANALARAGFVVIALTHTGDNFRGATDVANRRDLIDRPRQIKMALDWMLSSWDGHGNLNPRRVGMFGFDLGGFTAGVLLGGVPKLARMAQLCNSTPTAPECAFIRNVQGDDLDPNPAESVWVHDARIKAAVIAAPAAGYLFAPGSLRAVSAPIQMWRAEKDTQSPDAWNGAFIRDDLRVHPDAHTVEGADHFVFLAPCSGALAASAPQICQDASGFDRTAFHRAFNQSVIDFFTTNLRDR